MSFIDFLRRPSDEVILAARLPVARVKANSDRYNLAIAQCVKGDERLARLKQERDFWRDVTKAQQRR